MVRIWPRCKGVSRSEQYETTTLLQVDICARDNRFPATPVAISDIVLIEQEAITIPIGRR
jgi:hypothetical protein